MRDSTLLKRGKWKYIEYTYRDSSPKNENSVINYSPSCRSKPVRPSFIFGTQIKIFLIKSKSSLTLHRQQHNWNVPRSRNIARTSVRESMWHQGFNRNFTKLREYVLCAKKTKITTYSTILLLLIQSAVARHHCGKSIRTHALSTASCKQRMHMALLLTLAWHASHAHVSFMDYECWYCILSKDIILKRNKVHTVNNLIKVIHTAPGRE